MAVHDNGYFEYRAFWIHHQVVVAPDDTHRNIFTVYDSSRVRVTGWKRFQFASKDEAQAAIDEYLDA